MEGPDRLYLAFHISEGAVFKRSNLSFAYLHRFSHFISFFCLYLDREAKRKTTADLREGKCLKIDPPGFSTYWPRSGISNLEGSIFRPFSYTESLDRIALIKITNWPVNVKGILREIFPNGARSSPRQ